LRVWVVGGEESVESGEREKRRREVDDPSAAIEFFSRSPKRFFC